MKAVGLMTSPESALGRWLKQQKTKLKTTKLKRKSVNQDSKVSEEGLEKPL